MKYNQVEFFSVANGDGIRTVLWVQGCNHHCVGCQNPQTWDSSAGRKYTEDVEKNIMNSLESEYVSGITLSGGDPLFPDNRDDVTALCKRIKEKYPNKTIWLYTGYLYEEVLNLDIMGYIDVLVDGEYHAEERNLALPYCGSENQRVINVPETRRRNEVVLL